MAARLENGAREDDECDSGFPSFDTSEGRFITRALGDMGASGVDRGGSRSCRGHKAFVESIVVYVQCDRCNAIGWEGCCWWLSLCEAGETRRSGDACRGLPVGPEVVGAADLHRVVEEPHGDWELTSPAPLQAHNSPFGLHVRYFSFQIPCPGLFRLYDGLEPAPQGTLTSHMKTRCFESTIQVDMLRIPWRVHSLKKQVELLISQAQKRLT